MQAGHPYNVGHAIFYINSISYFISVIMLMRNMRA